jgi:hypothetical protein
MACSAKQLHLCENDGQAGRLALSCEQPAWSPVQWVDVVKLGFVQLSSFQHLDWLFANLALAILVSPRRGTHFQVHGG